MILFFIASELAVALAHNHFVQYAESDGPMVLPLITDMVLSLRKAMILSPLLWGGFSYLVYRFVREKGTAERNEVLLAFSLITIAVGLLMLIFFGLGGILPYYRIGTLVQ
ncbi:MAG: hypothetical protein JW932_12860 [Deltaproteobacteria bacterium]|nr:hypothetical protein [Deltaproteobacteria bacterium]